MKWCVIFMFFFLSNIVTCIASVYLAARLSLLTLARAHKQSERTKRSKRAKRKQALSSERGKLLHNPIPNLHFPLGKSRLLYSDVRTKDSISSSNTSSLFTLNAATRTNAAFVVFRVASFIANGCNTRHRVTLR